MSESQDKFEPRLSPYWEFVGPLVQDGGLIENDTCPHCGGRERIFENFYNMLVREKKAMPGMRAFSSTTTQAFLGPLSAQLVGSKVPTVTVYRDICKHCMTEYPVAIGRIDQIAGSPDMKSAQGWKNMGTKNPGRAG